MDAAKSGKKNYKVRLRIFEGPLDLLLHLIRINEVDIYDIPISIITDQFLDYVELMKSLNLDFAGEFLTMAATLMQIKSRMLLPLCDEEEEEEEDPRMEIVAKLLEYQKYKEAAGQIRDRDILDFDVFSRGQHSELLEEEEEEFPTVNLSIFQLVDALTEVLKKLPDEETHFISTDHITIAEKINDISLVLQARKTVTFIDLFQSDRSRLEIIVTFLAILEMARLRLINIFQLKPFDVIRIAFSENEQSTQET